MSKAILLFLVWQRPAKMDFHRKESSETSLLNNQSLRQIYLRSKKLKNLKRAIVEFKLEILGTNLEEVREDFTKTTEELTEGQVLS